MWINNIRPCGFRQLNCCFPAITGSKDNIIMRLRYSKGHLWQYHNQRRFIQPSKFWSAASLIIICDLSFRVDKDPLKIASWVPSLAWWINFKQPHNFSEHVGFKTRLPINWSLNNWQKMFLILFSLNDMIIW